MNEVWELSLLNDGKTSTITGKSINGLMKYLTMEGINQLQIAMQLKEMKGQQKLVVE